MRASFFFLYARTRAREIFDTRNRSLCLSRVSCKCLSLGFEFRARSRSVPTRRKRRRRRKRKGRKERRPRETKRRDPRKGGAFSTTGRAVEEAKQEGGRFRNVIAGRSEIHPNGGAFSPRKKKNTFLRGAFVAKLKGSFFFSSLSLSFPLSLSPSLPLYRSTVPLSAVAQREHGDT